MNKARYCSAKGSVVARVKHAWVFAVCVLLSIPLTRALGQDATNCVTPPSGLIAWWPGDGTALDLVNTNHGILQNGVSYAEGKAGQAFSLDGMDDRVFIPESPTVDLSRMTNWTIQAWVRPTSFSSKSYLTIYSEGYWRVLLGVDNPTGKPENWINNANQFLGAVALQISNWNHVALTFDGTNRTFYVNGAFAGSSNSPVATSDNNGAAIGDVAPTYNSAQFQGQIDEVALFNRALTSNEVAAIYAAGSAGMCYTNNPAPVFVVQPVSQTGFVANAVTLTGMAMGSPRPTYQWIFNNTPIPNATNTSLTLTNLAITDSGNYTLLASNTHGIANSTVASLTVPDSDPPCSCLELFTKGVTNNGYYAIDPDGSGGNPPFTVHCVMSLAGGGWTKLTSQLAATPLNTNETLCREYLYLQNSSYRWYRTPRSSLVWSWASGKDLYGTYYYSSGTSESKFFVTLSSERQRYGVGGSSGPGPTYKCLVYYDSCVDPVNAQVQLCQDRPGIFCGACCCDVSVYIRTALPRRPPEVFNNPETFETGWGDWSSDNYYWEIRPPENGPVTAYRGTNAACSNPGGNYFASTSSRLISPSFTVPAVGVNSRVVARFQQWYQYGSGDIGQVQISIWNGYNWESWNTLLVAATNGISTNWTQVFVDLSAYQGQQARLAFYHTANSDASLGVGWYLDDLELSSFVPTPLTLGQVTTNSFTTNGQHQFFVVQVPAGGHLRLTLHDLDQLGVNELYICRGALPSAGAYDYRFKVNGAADQTVFVPDAGAGPWYVLAYNASGPVPGDYTLDAKFSVGVMLESVTPSNIGNSVPGTIAIEGAGFTPRCHGLAGQWC